MDTLIILALFAPLILLILALIRHATRIRRDAIDKDTRTERIDELNPAIVRFALERDSHTCKRCGSTSRVGVDFRGETPEGQSEVTPGDLEACCAACFLKQWKTLQGTPASGSNHV
jgi:5-methylcytosine-specific restriction endonuclease McrA